MPGAIYNSGGAQYGAQPVTINGYVYNAETANPSQDSAQVDVRDGVTNARKNFAVLPNPSKATFELTWNGATMPVPQVGQQFTYTHNPTDGPRNWVIVSKGETHQAGVAAKVSVSCEDVTGCT